MGLRAGLWKLLARGEEGDPDPDELVELITVPQFEAPLVEADLASQGIEATVEDAFDLVTRTLSKSRILVRRADLLAAQEALVAGSAGG